MRDTTKQKYWKCQLFLTWRMQTHVPVLNAFIWTTLDKYQWKRWTTSMRYKVNGEMYEKRRCYSRVYCAMTWAKTLTMFSNSQNGARVCSLPTVLILIAAVNAVLLLFDAVDKTKSSQIHTYDQLNGRIYTASWEFDDLRNSHNQCKIIIRFNLIWIFPSVLTDFELFQFICVQNQLPKNHAVFILNIKAKLPRK